MIRTAIQDRVDKTWQKQLNDSFVDVTDLLNFLNLSPETAPFKVLESSHFPFRVTRYFASLMKKNNWHDPLLKQVLPVADEYIQSPEFTNDPVGDLQVTENSILNKYPDRSLIITTGACAINCRYCFRRNFPYSKHLMRENEIPNIVHSVKNKTEVILSGGDPLCLSDSKLELLLFALNKQPGIRRIRIHSRLPVVLPQRITPSLLSLLGSLDKQIVLVIHANHANEISSEIKSSVLKLKQVAHLQILNQAVLLKGINHDVESQVELSEKLFEAGIMPYYLHFLDKVTGTTHFSTSLGDAVELENALRSRLPGYLVPKLVIEQPGKQSKLPVSDIK